MDEELLKHVALQYSKQIEPFMNFLQLSKSALEDGNNRAAKVQTLHTTPRILNSEAFDCLLSICIDIKSVVITIHCDDDEAELDPGWDGDDSLRLSAWPGNRTSIPARCS